LLIGVLKDTSPLSKEKGAAGILPKEFRLRAKIIGFIMGGRSRRIE
jgi:hypothetical protein